MNAHISVIGCAQRFSPSACENIRLKIDCLLLTFQPALDVNASGGRYISYFIPVNVTITETITELIVSEKICFRDVDKQMVTFTGFSDSVLSLSSTSKNSQRFVINVSMFFG